MPSITQDTSLQTVLTTFETSPANCPALMEELRAAYSDFISRQPGFVSAALHVNDAQTRVANYSQWRTRDDFQGHAQDRRNARAPSTHQTPCAVGSSR